MQHPPRVKKKQCTANGGSVYGKPMISSTHRIPHNKEGFAEIRKPLKTDRLARDGARSSRGRFFLCLFGQFLFFGRFLRSFFRFFFGVS